MAEALALKPALFSAAAPGAAAEPPALKGGRCTCGYVFFPMQTYGCERCGRWGEDLQPALLAGCGTLIASARVHMHARKDRTAPFTVGSVKLADGPVVRTLLAEEDGGSLTPGQAMVATLVEVGRTDAGAPLVDLRFMPVR